MPAAYLLLAAASISGILGYLVYYRALRRDADDSRSVEPNRWTWLIWGIAMAVESWTYDALSSDPMKTWLFYASTVCCILLSIAVWRFSKWERPTVTECVCVALSLIAIVAYLAGGDAWWSHLVALSAIPIGFLPTWKSAWKTPEHERSSAWVLWGFAYACIIGLVLLRLESYQELPYAIVDGICHLSIFFIVKARSG
ncbi:MAG: hypothetical protein QOE22_324 [Candidatus Parcubacteria bacterium]|jgi:hypothetical protein|nr:hypothetical protein [Candidatus Parcubacteria bacterium]